MRMERLLADIEAANEARNRADARAEVAEGVRAEQAGVTLADRLRAGLGSIVALTVAGQTLRGRLVDVGEGWLALERVTSSSQPEGIADLVRPGIRIVPLGAIAGVAGLGRTHRTGESSTIGRGWSSLLRAVARSRTSVAWHPVMGEVSIGSIDAVGADHVLMRPHHASETIVLPLAALAWLDLGASR